MSKLIEELNRIDIQVQDKISLTDNIKIYGLYENGDYDKYLNTLVDTIIDKEYIDIYSLFLALNSELILGLFDQKNISDILISYVNFVINRFDILSPSDSNQKKKLCENGLKSFATILIANLQNTLEQHKSNLNINASIFLQNMNNLFSFLNQYGIKTEGDLNILNLVNILKMQEKKEQQREKKIQSEEENKKEENKKEENKKEEKANMIFSSEERDSKSINVNIYKWDILVAKIETLKQLIDDEKIFEASIAYEDIESRLKNFDLKEYFPEILFPLYKKIAPVATKIYKAREKLSNTIQWQMAKQIYNTDFRRFSSEVDKMPENDLINYLDQNDIQNNDFHDHDHEQEYDSYSSR